MNRFFRFSVLFFAVTGFPFIYCNALADDPGAREIMQKVDDRDEGDNMTSEIEMTLIDKNGKKRFRKIKSYSKDKGDDSLGIMFFLHPADVKNTGFLTCDYDGSDKDDDQWLYLPALRKTKRIASSNKSGSFMGSDFNYSDMTSRELDDYDFTFYEKGREKMVRGKKVWVIESVPRSKKVIKETGYKKSLVFVRQDNFCMVRAILWEDTGSHMKYMDVKNLEKIDGIWVGTEVHMTRKKGKKTVHKTILKMNNVKFNQDLSYDMFTVRRLEKGL